MTASVGKVVTSVFRPLLFKNKVAIITGGATGIGKAITQELLYLGCNVMIASRKVDSLEKAETELQAWLRRHGRSESQLQTVPCNIRKEQEVQNLISSTLDKFGQLDFVVNNGGGQFLSPARDISTKGWQAVIETNLTGTFLMCREAYTQWMEDNGGAVVNIIANMWNGFPFVSHTGAARSAVDNLTKSLAIEWVHSGVRINAVAPGTIYSTTASANYEYDVFAETEKLQPYRRHGSVEEVSGAVCFLLSPAARFVTGATLRVDAAQSLYNCPTLVVPEHDKMPVYTWETDVQEQSDNSHDSS
ncbi:peroxisomal trans-2-enoyl-CoA reductase [Aplysia californica]|uniref:Peroxisomal trans-2-enoyl-CoA reductase n=1 Tax=Aplysia californica TaxID=6500 RepID=A0ABM0JR95_APLCA|nr:peroxisomal trans-2-enoyl-CoA reductase [Aplysia californica]